MKKFLPLFVMFFMAIGTNAQGLKISPHYFSQQREALKARTEKANIIKAEKMKAAGTQLGEYSEIVSDNYSDDDVRYRYVFSYNTNGERVSEAIYATIKENGVWGEEQFITLGTYTYGYDTTGRINMKQVTYAPEPEDYPYYSHISSYYVTVSYDSSGNASYSKYVKEDTDYTLDETWGYYANGALSSYSNLVGSNTSGYAVEYDKSGLVSMFSDSEYNKTLYSGSLNERTITNMSNYNDAWEIGDTYRYKYDGSTGALLEYEVNSSDSWPEPERYVFSYDAFGRISTITHYQVEDENSGPVEEVQPTSTTTKWGVDFVETFTYFNDEVYSVGNVWYNVFGFDGPIASYEFEAPNEEYSQTLTFNRDSQGKLLSVDYTTDNSGVEAAMAVDSNGHITSVETSDSDGQYRNTYTWENDQVTKEESYSYDYLDYTCSYEYGDNWFKAKRTASYDDTCYNIYEVSKVGSKYISSLDVYEYGSLSDYQCERIILNIQQEDVSFVRPHINKDFDGMVVEHPIVVSQAGRVVCSSSYYSDYNDDIFRYPSEIAMMENKYLVVNMVEEALEDDAYDIVDLGMPVYYDVTHDGDNTICSNADGLPVFILTGNKLLKEYVYKTEEEADAMSPSTSITPTSVTIPNGQAYDEISYAYNTDGLLTGKSIVSVDSNGSKTEEIELEYKYIGESNIESIEIKARPAAIINGRTLGFSDNASFSVYTLDGRQIAMEQNSFTLPNSGVYIIVVNGQSLKLHIK